MSDVELLVPLSDAVEWEPWLTDALADEAHASQVGYDGGEEEGRYESHLFTGSDAAAVALIAQRALKRRRVSRQVTVTSADKVTVSGASTSSSSSEWIITQPLPGRYGRALRELCKRLNSDDQMKPWLAAQGYALVTVRQVPGGYAEALFQPGPADGSPDELFMIAPVDLSIYEEGPAAQGNSAQRLARENMRTVLDRLAVYLGSPVPTTAELRP